MSSIRKVFWRGGFALAMVPVSLGLVAASPAAHLDTGAGFRVQLTKVELREQMHEQEAAIARQFASGEARELRVALAIAQSRKQAATRAQF